MSIKYISAVAENPTFTPAQKLVLMCLGDHADQNGYSWPSLKRIMAWTGLSNRTVFSTLTEMGNEGCLRRDSGKGSVNHYQLDLVKIITRCNSSPGEEDHHLPGEEGHHLPGEEVHHEPSLEPSLEPSRESSAKKPAREKRHTEITEDFRVTMRERFSAALGQTVDERIDQALAHKARLKYSDVQQYVMGWLRRDAEGGHRPTPTQAAIRLHERKLEVEHGTPSLRTPFRP